MLKKFAPLFLLLASPGFAQTPLQQTQARLEKYTEAFPMEKAYLHTDKSDYTAGDTIWYKAYLVEAMFHQPDSASGALYINLIREGDNTVAIRKILRVKGGVASGAMSLPDTLQPGNYQLRCYTNWMLNFPQEHFFRKTIRIYTTQQVGNEIGETKTLAERSTTGNIYFFPEGGNLINGLSGRVAYKAVDESGRGINIAGYVVSNLGDTITFTQSQHLGMGYFMLTPEANKSYTFFPTGSPLKFPVPQAADHGYTMLVDNFNKTNIKVFSKHNLPQADRAILIALQRGHVIYAAQSNSDNSSCIFAIPKAQIASDGIVHLTLFNSKGEPQCERVVYVDKNRPLKTVIKPDKPSYKPREKVTLEVLVTDQLGVPVSGNFSLSATDLMQVKANSLGQNIQSYFLLSSDVQDAVKGYIEQPAHYFNTGNARAEVGLDLLLMTQGWRRFLWSDVLKESQPTPKFQLEDGLTVSGQILLPNGKPAKKAVEMTLLYDGGAIWQSTDANGRFVVNDVFLVDSARVLVQGRKESGGRNLNAAFDEPYIPTPEMLRTEPGSDLATAQRNVWLQRRLEHEQIQKALYLQKIQMLKAIDIEGTRIEDDPRRKLYGNRARTFKVDDQLCATAMNVFQYLQGRYPNLLVSGMGPQTKVTIRGSKPTILVDGMQIDMEYASTISPCDVEAIDVAGVTSYAAGRGGLISILTKRGNTNHDWKNEEALGVKVATIIGFDSPREFFSPSYVNMDPHTKTPDYRSTLFWEPNVQTDKDGKAIIQFYNSDNRTSINVSLEGLTASGSPVVSETQYKIE